MLGFEVKQMHELLKRIVDAFCEDGKIVKYCLILSGDVISGDYNEAAQIGRVDCYYSVYVQ